MWWVRRGDTLVAGEGTPSPAEYQAPGHVDQAVIEDIATFIEGAP